MIDEIIYILPDSNGGVASVVANLLKYSQSKIKKSVLLLRFDTKNNISSRLSCDKQVVVNISQQQSLASIYKSICKHITPNSVVVANDGWYEIEALKYCKLDNPVVYILHGNFRFYYDNIYKNRDRISSVITVSSFLKQQAEKYFDGEVSFVRFPIDTTPIADFSKHEQDPLIINYAGRLEAAKGTQYFPVITDALEEHSVRYIMNIYGTGEHFDMLSKYYENNRHVCLHGQTPRADILQSNVSSNIYLLLSQTEGLPVSVVEAMKSGCVPIVFNIPSGVNDIIKNEENGYIVIQGDANAVADKIIELDQDRNLLLDLSRAAIESTRASFDPHIQTAEYERTMVEAQRVCRTLSPFRKFLMYLPAYRYYVVNAYIKKFQEILKIS